MGVEAGFHAEHCHCLKAHLLLQILPGVRSELLSDLRFGYSLPLPGVAMVQTIGQLATPHSEPINSLRSSALEPTVDSNWLFRPMDSASSWVLF